MEAMVAALMLTLFAGCLLPPPIEEVAAPENQPPRIVPGSLWPSPWTDGPIQMRRGTGCPTEQFQATITDPDPDTTLYWREFLDYHSDPRPRDALTGTETPNQKPVTITLPVNPSDTRFAAAGTHLVELLLSDGPFTDDNSDPGRAVAPGALTDSVIWTILLEDKSCGPL